MHSDNPYRADWKSRRFHDLGNRTYMYCKLELTSARISPVTVESGCYWGRCEEEITRWDDEKWKGLRDFFNPLFDNGMPMWEDLTDEQFTDVLEILRKAA
jgi:hypothetical protein